MKRVIEQMNDAMLKASPGIKEDTINALNIALSKLESHCKKCHLEYDESKIKILNVGSGKGLENLWILESSNIELHALDAHNPYLIELEHMIKKNGFSKRLKTYLDDMSSMPFKKNSFDIIWCEGSISYLGFERGIKEFKKFLKPNGIIVVADYALNMDKNDSKFPYELKDYFEGFYPSIDMHENNIFLAEDCNYNIIATFQVQEESWHTNYFSIVSQQCKKIESENSSNLEIKNALKEMMLDSKMHEKYNKYYDYYFYIFQKNK